MQNDRSPLTNADIVAYADGTIDPARRARVADLIARDPEAAAAVDAFRRQTAALKAGLDPVIDEAVPQRLLLMGDTGSSFGWRSIAAAACLMFAVGAGVGWSATALTSDGPSLDDTLGRRAALAFATFAEVGEPMLDVSADTVFNRGWLANAVGVTVDPPVLTDLGFELRGGRLMMGEAAPAAMLIYEDEPGRRLGLYVRTDIATTAQTPLRSVNAPDGAAVYWSDGAVGIGLSGAVEADELEAVARLVRAQLAT